LNDGISVLILNDIQKKYMKLFLADKRIKKQLVLNCPLCGEDKSILIAEKDRYAIPLKTVVCERCGLIRNYEQLNKESSKMFYSTYYRKIYEGVEKPDCKSIENRYSIGAKQRIPAYLKKDRIILEIGCGGGWNLMPFYNQGYKYYGFDFDKDYIEYGKSKGLNLYLDGINEIVKMGIKCDYLLLSHVLEHTNNPNDLLSNLEPLLKTNAIINIKVPNLDAIFWGCMKSDFLKTLQNAHNFTFDNVTLNLVGHFSKYEVIFCFGGNLILINKDTSQKSPDNLLYKSRGTRVTKKLKLLSSFLRAKNQIGIDKVYFRKLYWFTHFFKSLKRFRIEYMGRI